MNVLLPRTSLQPARSASDLFEEFDRLRNQLLGAWVSNCEEGVGRKRDVPPDVVVALPGSS